MKKSIASFVLFFKSIATNRCDFYLLFYLSFNTYAENLNVTATVFDINQNVYSFESRPYEMTWYDGKIYFSANGISDNSRKGIELWSYDPITRTARLTVDINIGGKNNSSRPSKFTVYNEKLYFSADDGIHGQELWSYDNQTGEASLVKDIFEGENNSKISNMTTYNKKLYFTANDGIHGEQLWAYNSSSNSISMITNFSPTQDSGIQGQLTIFDKKLYFTAAAGNYDLELWVYDDEVKNTTLVADIFKGEDASLPLGLTVFDGKLYFTASDETNSRSLWVLNNSSEIVSKEINLTDISKNNIHNLTVFDNKLCFSVTNHGDNYKGIRCYDPTEKSFNIVTETTRSYENLTILFSHKNLLFYALERTSNDSNVKFPADLFVVDNTTGISKNITENLHLDRTAANMENWFFLHQDKVYISGGLNRSGTELLQYDLIEEKVTLAADLYSGNKYSVPQNFIPYNNKVYFSAKDGVHGKELWAYDKNKKSVSLVADLDGGSGSWNLANFIVYQDKLYFTAVGEHSSDNELWVYDDVTNSASQVKDINRGDEGSFVDSKTIYKGDLYFSATDGENGYGLWRYNNITNEVLRISNIFPLKLIVFEEELFFLSLDESNYYQLWSYDNLDSQPRLVFQTSVKTNGEFRTDMFIMNNQLYFKIGGPVWLYDKENATADILFSTDDYGGYLVLGDKFFFSEGNYENRFALKVYDSITKKAHLIFNDQTSDYILFPENLIAYKNKLYFNYLPEFKGLGSNFWSYDLKTEVVNLVGIDVNFSHSDTYPICSIVIQEALFCRASLIEDNFFLDWELLLLEITGHAPVIIGTPESTVYQDDRYEFIPEVIDYDGDALTFSIENKPEWMSFNENTGAITGTPTNDDVGIYENILMIVSDGDNPIPLPEFDIAVVNINDAPIIGGEPELIAKQSELYEFIPQTLDIDGDELIFSIKNRPKWANFDESTGLLSGTPKRTSYGLYESISVSVTDSKLSDVLAPFSINVSVINNIPLAVDDQLQTDDKTSLSINVLSNDSDADGDTLTVVDASAIKGSVIISKDSSLQYTPVVGYFGSDEITYQISDGFGGNSSAIVTVSITLKDQEKPNTPSSGGSLYALVFLILLITSYRYYFSTYKQISD